MMFLRSLSQSKLSWLLAIYIGFILNIAIFYRKAQFLFHSEAIDSTAVGAFVIELFISVLLTFFLMRITSLGGRLFFRIMASFFLVMSVIASYYMAFFNVTIGYGIIAAAMTTDIDLSKEVVGFKFVIWLFLMSALPLWLIWKNSLQDTYLEQLKSKGKRLTPSLVLLACVLLVWKPIDYIDNKRDEVAQKSNVDLPSYGGLVAHSYVPSNWLSGLGLFVYTQYQEQKDGSELLDPLEKFTYVAPEGIDDTYVIFVLGETTRWDHMGMLGYERDTTPLLAKEKNLVAMKGHSCDTSTKLSMRCMFVREGGASDNEQRTLLEKNIFAVLKGLGFSSELYAMQSETWFYKSIAADDYMFREMIASEKQNEGKPVSDILLVDKVTDSVKRHPNGKHLVVLHTKGSHYLYSMRYPREFAKYQPECMGVDASCNKEQLINAYDNSVLYTDYIIHEVINQVRDKKAIVFYAADHGESIADNYHLHGTPRNVAPAEQFRSPMMVWASDQYLESEQNQKNFNQLKQLAATGATHRHEAIFDTVLGCLGYTSPNGGIHAKNNACEATVSDVK